MVKVDDLNESIEAFGTIVKRFDEIQESYKKIEELIKLEDESLNEIKKLRDQQKEFLDTEKGLELSIDRKIENAESSLKDKIELSGHDVFNKISTNAKSNTDILKGILEQKIIDTQDIINVSTSSIVEILDEQNNIFSAEINKMKIIETCTLVGIAIVIVLQIVKFFI